MDDEGLLDLIIISWNLPCSFLHSLTYLQRFVCERICMDRDVL